MKKQTGMTFVGMLLTMAVVIMSLIIVMKIVPVYIQHYSVIQSIKSLHKIPDTEFSSDPAVNANILRDKLDKQLYVNGVEIPNDKILIKPMTKGRYSIAISYQVTKPLISHISLLFDFNVAQEVDVGSN